jgi:hypothetical protein
VTERHSNKNTYDTSAASAGMVDKVVCSFQSLDAFVAVVPGIFLRISIIDYDK